MTVAAPIDELLVDRLEALENGIARLTEQVSVLVTEAEHQRRRRASIDDLARDLSVVSSEAMSMATRELETVSATVDLADSVRLLRRIAEAAPTLERALVALDAAFEFVADVTPLGAQAMAVAVDRLDGADRTGYFRLAGAVAGVADRVVMSFDEHDVELLGDNVVAMLDAFREVTQPEMLTFLSRMVDAVHAEQHAVDWEPDEPPGLWTLARQIRDPDVRRGLARAIHTLRAVAVETGPHADRTSAARRRSGATSSTTSPTSTTHDAKGDVT